MSNVSDTGTLASEIFIRAYRSQDWPDVCDIHDAARPQEVAGVMPPGTFAPMSKAAVDEGFFDDAIFVACENEVFGPLMGFIAIAGPWITWVYVKPAAQGRGIGRAMIDYIRPFVEPDGVLTVLATNTKAIGFYKSQGFVPAAIIPGDCEGYACEIIRMCLPTSRYRDLSPKPMESSLTLAGYSAENWGHAERDADGIWRWVA